MNQPTWTGRSGLSGSVIGASTQRFGTATNPRMAAQASAAAEANGSSAPSQVCTSSRPDEVQTQHPQIDCSIHADNPQIINNS